MAVSYRAAMRLDDEDDEDGPYDLRYPGRRVIETAAGPRPGLC